MLETVARDRVLSYKTISDLRRLSHLLFADRVITPEEVTHILKLCDAYWIHSGDPKDPHVELTSGKCSNGFVDVLRAVHYTNICQLLGHQMVKVIETTLFPESDDEAGYDGDNIDWVIGSDHAGAAISHSVATILGVQHDFTEKGPNKTQLWKRFPIRPGDAVLQVEDLMTTTGTTLAVRSGIREGSAPNPVVFVPVVGVVVHRSNVYEIEGSPVVYLAHYDIDDWKPQDCPLCAAGSERLRPKQNWDRLTGKK